MTVSAQEKQRLGEQLNAAGGETLLDQRVRRGGSHYAKTFVTRHPDKPQEDLAFVGRIDLCHGRRDNDVHEGDPQEQPMDRRYRPRAPWHDAALELRGPVVGDVLASFVERWNDPQPLPEPLPEPGKRDLMRCRCCGPTGEETGLTPSRFWLSREAWTIR